MAGDRTRQRPRRLSGEPDDERVFFSRSETIWGGTSQIQRNIVGLTG